METIKNMDFASTFYPLDKNEINNYFNHFNKILDNNLANKDILDITPRALIVPHAGYIYSGFTANFAYRLLKNSTANRIIVIGPSHKVSFNGISGLTTSLYETPLGNLEIDLNYLSFLKTKFNISYHQDIHHEHSSETQMPFIKYYKSKSKILELIYSSLNYEDLSNLINLLIQDKNNLVIISTDLSHFYKLKEANHKDNQCIEAIIKKDLDIYKLGCEACGEIGVKAIIKCSKNNNLTPYVLDYRTSYDYSKDESSVVGYLSVAFC
jgi:AmmeMemoRadiSam system protein B